MGAGIIFSTTRALTSKSGENREAHTLDRGRSSLCVKSSNAMLDTTRMKSDSLPTSAEATITEVRCGHDESR